MTSDPIVLARGSHEPPADDCGNPERCLFEWYNWLAHRQHTDACPPGVSPVLHAFGMRLNDRLPDTKRQQLLEFLPNGGPSPLDGTADDGLDDARVLMATNWAVHTGARAWLAAAGLDDETTALNAIPAITDRPTLNAALPAIRDIRDRLWAKRTAFYRDLRAKVRAKIAETKPAGAVAVAVAVAAAAAAAAADADAAANAAANAAADAAAVADAAANAAANAAADAVAVADAVADAAADAVAVANAAADPWSDTYNKIYKPAYAAALKAIEDKHGPTITQLEDSAIALYRAMIRPEPHEPALD